MSSSRKRLPAAEDNRPAEGYAEVLADLTNLITDSRRRAAAAVNQELVAMYWQIGAVIVQQQEQAQWGDFVVKQLATDLRSAFPDLKGLTRDNLFRMRQFFVACREVDDWLAGELTQATDVPGLTANTGTVGALTRHFEKQQVGPPFPTYQKSRAPSRKSRHSVPTISFG